MSRKYETWWIWHNCLVFELLTLIMTQLTQIHGFLLNYSVSRSKRKRTEELGLIYWLLNSQIASSRPQDWLQISFRSETDTNGLKSGSESWLFEGANTRLKMIMIDRVVIALIINILTCSSWVSLYNLIISPVESISLSIGSS